MNNNLVSVDFWDTLVRADSNGEKRSEVRMKAVRTLSRRYGKEPTEEAIQNANEHISRAFDEEWFSRQRTQSTEELARSMLDLLAIPANPAEVADLAEAFCESLFLGPPELAPEVKEALAGISIYYRMAIVSDTMFTPGSVIRRYLDQMGILHHFEAFAFSDEVGVSKPHPKAYEKVLRETGADAARSWHVGDMLRTDITGARAMGMKCILYTGISGDSDTKRTKSKDSSADASPDYSSDSWENVADILISEL